MDKYLESITNNAIETIQYQIDKWRADGVDITRDDIDGALDQYYDTITGNSTGATPTRIYNGDAREFYENNANTDELREWLEDCDSLDLMAKYYAEGNYNALDVLESIRVYEYNRDSIVDAVCKYYGVTEGGK